MSYQTSRERWVCEQDNESQKDMGIMRNIYIGKSIDYCTNRDSFKIDLLNIHYRIY